MSTTTELAVVEATASDTNLFAADGPLAVLEEVKRIVGPLGAIIRENNMVVAIKGSEHVTLEGWQVLGAMLGVSAHTVWSRPLAEPDLGWEARAEARTKQGEVVGSAEAMVTRAERNWKRADDHAMRSMAQTRAQSKALASALRFVMALTGAKGTPVEELGPEVEVPDWARPVRDLKEVMHAAADVIGASVDHDVAMERAAALCRRLYDDCGGEIPTVVWSTFSLLLGAMMNTDPIEEAEGGEENPPATVIEMPDGDIVVADQVDAPVDLEPSEPQPVDAVDDDTDENPTTEEEQS